MSVNVFRTDLRNSFREPYTSVVKSNIYETLNRSSKVTTILSSLGILLIFLSYFIQTTHTHSGVLSLVIGRLHLCTLEAAEGLRKGCLWGNFQRLLRTPCWVAQLGQTWNTTPFLLSWLTLYCKVLHLLLLNIIACLVLAYDIVILDRCTCPGSSMLNRMGWCKELAGDKAASLTNTHWPKHHEFMTPLQYVNKSISINIVCPNANIVLPPT